MYGVGYLKFHNKRVNSLGEICSLNCCGQLPGIVKVISRMMWHLERFSHMLMPPPNYLNKSLKCFMSISGADDTTDVVFERAHMKYRPATNVAIQLNASLEVCAIKAALNTEGEAILFLVSCKG